MKQLIAQVRQRCCRFRGVALLSACAMGAALAAPEPGAGAAPPGEETPAVADPNRYVKDGVVVDFQVIPPQGARDGRLMEGHVAEVRFRITEEATGDPVRGITPGAWMDMGQVLEGQSAAEQKSCKDKIALYLGGAVGIRPMLDLNSYYLVVMNREPTISIIDPLVSMVGKTSTLAMIRLQAAGADWAKSADERRLYISMPKAGKVAVVDTEGFKVVADVEAGAEPTRVALQPDGRYLWVGNNGASAEQSGVSVIDTESLEPVAQIATGLGHHEIAFSDDSRYAFVSNRESGTVSVIDVQALERVKDVETGPVPISLGWSSLAKTLYVADGQEGVIGVVDSRDLEVRRRIELAPGLGPLRFTQDGRFALVVNPSNDKVYVLDPATDTQLHAIEVKGKPFQLTVSRAFAYVRPLASDQVNLINLASLGKGKEPIVQRFSAGTGAPQLAGDLPLADSIATATTEAAGFIVNPTDNTTYFYMEGMNAPSSNYKVYGASARAVTVVDRSLKETEPGVYTSKVKIPVDGKYDVAFLLETPRLLHCFCGAGRRQPADQARGRYPRGGVPAPRPAGAGRRARPVPLQTGEPVHRAPSHRAQGRQRAVLPAARKGPNRGVRRGTG